MVQCHPGEAGEPGSSRCAQITAAALPACDGQSVGRSVTLISASDTGVSRELDSIAFNRSDIRANVKNVTKSVGTRRAGTGNVAARQRASCGAQQAADSRVIVVLPIGDAEGGIRGGRKNSTAVGALDEEQEKRLTAKHAKAAWP
jgi:hypothetical protein